MNLSIVSLILIQKIVFLEALTGSVILESITFEKIITKFRAVLVKFDIEFPYGEKHEEFEKVAKTVTNNDLLLAEVGVQQFGDKQNNDLMKNYGIGFDDFPVCKLFIDGDLKNPIDFDNEFKSDSIIRFIRKHSGLRITTNPVLEEFDQLANSFVQNITEEERNDIIDSVKHKRNHLTNEEHKKSVDNYIKFMDKFMKSGNQFIETEFQRLNSILSEKLAKNKRNEIKAKIDILLSFSMKQNIRKDEL